MVKEISNVNQNSELPHTIGRYIIDRIIEKGSMGIIYQGRDPYIKRLVALKVTLPEDTLPEDQIQNYRERFFTEAQAAGSLIHPNIVAIHDAGLEGNSCYISMEFVEGGNLINFCSKDKLLPLDKIVDITAKICEALDFAHQQGIIHQDIKPANIMITQRGIVKITDFGVAKLPRTDLAESGGIIGSPAYMAPEMLRDGLATMRSDLFSLGVTLYELLTGEQPFQAETMIEIINKVIHHDPTPIYQLNPTVPESVSQIVMQAMAKNPIHRFPGTMEFLFYLKTAWKESKLKSNAEKPDERIKYLKALKFFKAFKEEELAEVLRIGTWFHYKRGTIIIKEEERSNYFFIVILGQVQVEKKGELIALIDRGSCFGEMAALSNQKRSASIVATEDSVVMRVDASIIDKLSKDLHIRFYKQFITTLISRLEATSERIRK
jgi:serine/threonine protein kinase